MLVSEFPVVLIQSVMPPRKRRQIITFVSSPYNVLDQTYAKLDQMLKLMRDLRRKNLDIYHLIWNDVMSVIFDMRYSMVDGVTQYIPRQYTLRTFVSPPKPPIRTYVSNPDE